MTPHDTPFGRPGPGKAQGLGLDLQTPGDQQPYPPMAPPADTPPSPGPPAQAALAGKAPPGSNPKSMLQGFPSGFRAEDHDVLLPRGGSWSSLSSLGDLRDLYEAAAAGDALEDTSPKRSSSVGSFKRRSNDLPAPLFVRQSTASIVTSDGAASVLSVAPPPSLAMAKSHALLGAAPSPQLTTHTADSALPRLAGFRAQPSLLLPAACRVLSAAGGWALALLASCLVSLYDLAMRCAMVSYYIVGLDRYRCAQTYLEARALKQTRRYIAACSARFEESVSDGKVRLDIKASFSRQDLDFATTMLRTKHAMPALLVLAWRCFASLLAHSPCARFTVVTAFSDTPDTSADSCASACEGRVVAVFMEFRQRAVHHFITALVDHDASRQHGIYIAKYHDLLSTCIEDGVPTLRLGPTTDELKRGLGAVPLPLLAVGSAVWARLEGRCSVVCFGIFTSVALFLYLLLTQSYLDTSGVGALTLAELAVLYACSMACVKLLPLWSIGLARIWANPRKYLLQTSFYAQGVIPGAAVGIALICAWRQVSPLGLLDGLSLYIMVGEAIGRLGCHFYGCCFGRALSPDPTTFSRWGVVYTHPSSSVARLRPEYLLRPLLPTQVLQSLYAITCQVALLALIPSTPSTSPAHPPSASPSWVHPGTVGVAALALYSLGRLIFFTLREDENFKSNRSYTTAYVALATLAACAGLQTYSCHTAQGPAGAGAGAGRESEDSVAAAAGVVGHGGVAVFSGQGVEGGGGGVEGVWGRWAGYLAVAAAATAANFVVQALHHHDRVGTFPDLRALVAWRTDGSSDGLGRKGEAGAGGGAARAGRGRRQVWSSWHSEL